MRSIQRRFSILQQKRPQISSLLNFGAAIQGQAFSSDTIQRWFNRLVEKEDYERCDKRTILRHLLFLSGPEDTQNQPQIALQRRLRAHP